MNLRAWLSSTDSVSDKDEDYPEATTKAEELKTLTHPHELDPKLKGKKWEEIEHKDKPHG